VLRRISLILVVLALAATSLAFAPGSQNDFGWQLSPTGSPARLRGLSVVSSSVVWASGSGGTVLRTVNGGATWQSVGPPGTETLQFRDIEAFDASNAVILSIGNGGDSRVYVTSNGGQSWTLAFVNDDPNAFYDCMAFFDRHRGLALSDPVQGRFRILATSNGGQSWRVLDTEMPPALPGEFAFAASGQCITTVGGRDAFFGTGGDVVARVFHSGDRGQTWQVSTTPIRSGPSAGIFALAFRDPRHGLASGGDFLLPVASPDALALTENGGVTWQLVADAPNEYRSGAHWVNGQVAIIVGPTGSDLSADAGQSWDRFDSGSFDTVDCAGGWVCWAAGEQGRVAYLRR
jgi:photosystem II stability/assembly factor-like uncharacterized protein